MSAILKEEAEQRKRHQERAQLLAQDIINMKWWSMDNIIFSHKGLNRMAGRKRPINHEYQNYFYTNINPDTRRNPTWGDTYMTVAWVPQFLYNYDHHTHEKKRIMNDEWECVKMLATPVPPKYGYDSDILTELCTVLRIQNYTLRDQFKNFASLSMMMNQQPSLLNDKTSSTTTSPFTVGFHGCYHNEYLEEILLHNLNPSVCTNGVYGFGAYLAYHPSYCLGRGYASSVTTPSYVQASTGKVVSDDYAIVTVFACNMGVPDSCTDGRLAISPGHGAFVDRLENPYVMCFQEYERLYPAYVLIYYVFTNVISSYVGEDDSDYGFTRAKDTSGRWDRDIRSQDEIGVDVFRLAMMKRSGDQIETAPLPPYFNAKIFNR